MGIPAKGHPEILRRSTCSLPFLIRHSTVIINHFPEYKGVDQSRCLSKRPCDLVKRVPKCFKHKEQGILLLRPFVLACTHSAFNIKFGIRSNAVES